jgi:peptidoglycan hydrolase-like protein with peptidoglycan-binding domain
VASHPEGAYDVSGNSMAIHASFTIRRSLVAAVACLSVVSLLAAPSPSLAVGPTVPARPAAGPRAPSATTAPSPATGAKPVVKKATSSKTKTAVKKSAKKAPVVSGIGQGAKGAQVETIQTRLQELKYDIPEVTGIFGEQTYHAVMAFQKVNGLSRTGRVGPQTLAALQEATNPDPMLADGGADRIEVDIERQILMIWKANELDRVLSVSTGNNKDFCVLDPETNKTDCDNAKTPGGSFRVTRRWVGWRESRLGEMYNPLYFNGGIAIHGSPSVPAYPASHGCVRIPMVSAEWFPSEIPDGTPVYVFGPDKTPTPLKAKASATTKPKTTVPGASTLPGASTVPGGTVPPTVAATTSTTTTLVRLLTPGAATTLPAQTTASTIAAPTTPAPTVATTTTISATTSTSTTTTTVP